MNALINNYYMFQYHSEGPAEKFTFREIKVVLGTEEIIQNLRMKLVTVSSGMRCRYRIFFSLKGECNHFANYCLEK